MWTGETKQIYSVVSKQINGFIPFLREPSVCIGLIFWAYIWNTFTFTYPCADSYPVAILFLCPFPERLTRRIIDLAPDFLG